MSFCVNAQMCSYVRTLFEHPSKWYESYQVNGTKYLKSRRKLDDELQQQLNSCAGEIFVCGIPPGTQAEKIAEVASLVGELYILRFKVHFSGASRGFAYLQYIDPNLMPLALKRLHALFGKMQLRTIKVCASRNSSKLLLRKVFNMSPLVVYETLSKLTSFSNLIGHELSPGYFEYQIVFKCNEEAVRARREILKSILSFGPRAAIIWDAASRANNSKLQTTGASRTRFPHQQMMKNDENEMTGVHNFYPNLAPSNSSFVNDFRNMKLY